jgi:hypothetical protein
MKRIFILLSSRLCYTVFSMSFRPFISILITGLFLNMVMTPLPVFAEEGNQKSFTHKNFSQPIDAFSVTLPNNQANISYQYLEENTWSSWQEYQSDGDILPGEESELMMVPKNVTALRIHPPIPQESIHPITISHEPIKQRVTETASSERHIFSRQEWGAEESTLFRATPSPSDTQGGNALKGDNGMTQTSDKRAQDCMGAQGDFAEEFKIDRTVTTNGKGQAYAWPLQYSRSVKLLAIHHTALGVTNDPRSGVERMRALYKYHALTKQWGDIGYHYAIDENGKIYEGRQGGHAVVAGHAYCNNIGTIGIVLMGNFEIEKPSQEQVKSVQWLLADLAEEYGIQLAKPVTFHGKTFKSPIVGHRELLSTACPGATLFAGLSQIRSNVLDKRLTASVDFPEPTVSAPSSTKTSSGGSTKQTINTGTGFQEGIGFTGRSTIGINPGGKQRLSFTYTTGKDGVYQGKKIADLSLPRSDIKLWIDDGQYLLPVRTGILSPSDIPAGETLSFQLIIEAPMVAGTYPITIGGIRLTMIVEGRRARTGEYVNPFGGNSTLIVKPKTTSNSTITLRTRPKTPISFSASSKASNSPHPNPASAGNTTNYLPTEARKAQAGQLPTTNSSSISSLTPTPIRISLSIDPQPIISFQDSGFIGDHSINGGTSVSLLARGNLCVALHQGTEYASDSILRMRSFASNILTVQGVKGLTRLYVGNLECRVIDGKLALINELSLDEYMRGIAEEPDTEPYEKQRAFAIAARTYAAYYMDQKNRKFPNKPFDGSDDPAVFQSYAGADFADRNPQWRKAVESTKNQVLTYKNAIIKPPYFSSDDGRTRDPKEAGWNNFPNSELFLSKPDPWCTGMTLRGHGVGMSGCGAKGQAKEGRSAEQILQYYYPGVRIIENQQ